MKLFMIRGALLLTHLVVLAQEFFRHVFVFGGSVGLQHLMLGDMDKPDGVMLVKEMWTPAHPVAFRLENRWMARKLHKRTVDVLFSVTAEAVKKCWRPTCFLVGRERYPVTFQIADREWMPLEISIETPSEI